MRASVQTELDMAIERPGDLQKVGVAQRSRRSQDPRHLTASEEEVPTTRGPHRASRVGVVPREGQDVLSRFVPWFLGLLCCSPRTQQVHAQAEDTHGWVYQPAHHHVFPPSLPPTSQGSTSRDGNTFPTCASLPVASPPAQFHQALEGATAFICLLGEEPLEAALKLKQGDIKVLQLPKSPGAPAALHVRGWSPGQGAGKGPADWAQLPYLPPPGADGPESVSRMWDFCSGGSGMSFLQDFSVWAGMSFVSGLQVSGALAVSLKATLCSLSSTSASVQSPFLLLVPPPEAPSPSWGWESPRFPHQSD